MIFEVVHLKNVYTELGSDSLDPTMTIYLPDNLSEMGRQQQKRPCLLICPGGAYAMCSQREAEPIALQFLPEGFNVFILNYSVAPSRFPTQLREIACAMECIYQNADAWHCDLDRIVIMGFSAGGHLAAQYSNAFDWREIREIFPNSKPVQAVVLCYPVITADDQFAHKWSFENLLGHLPETDEEVKRFSCNQQVTHYTPPTFLWHTATDNCVSVMNSLLYARALAENHVPFAAHIYPAGDHGLATADMQTNTCLEPAAASANSWISSAKEWLRFTLKIYTATVS